MYRTLVILERCGNEHYYQTIPVLLALAYAYEDDKYLQNKTKDRLVNKDQVRTKYNCIIYILLFKF